MEESKYYIPEISEFHVGFEYEWLNENSDWIKEDSPIEITKEGYEKQTYGLRVKYLDKSDIESLGWVYDDSQPKLQWFRFKTYKLIWEFNKIIIWDNNQQNMLCKVPIKNKSELKRLMKQLEIC